VGGTTGTVAEVEDVAVPTLVASASAARPSEDKMTAAQRRIAVKNANIAISLADHAERVARKKARGAEAETQTASERLAALRRRTTERRNAATVADATDGAKNGRPPSLDRDLNGSRQESMATCSNGDVFETSDVPASNEDEKMHLVGDDNRAAAASCGEAVEADSTGLADAAACGEGGCNGATASAAAAWAQHALPRGGAGDGGRHLSAG
jgi:hypothetical protein